jgi:hypothetical protein
MASHPLAGLQGQNLKYHLPTGVGVISTPEVAHASGCFRPVQIMFHLDIN